MNPYETDRLLSEYLLFHYGRPEDVLTGELELGCTDILDFPVRCVTTLLDTSRIGADFRALDVGCAVGRASFELARHCREVIGIDYSRRFIETASLLQRESEVMFERVDEGELTSNCRAAVPPGVDRSRVSFEVGDATDLRDHLSDFDILLAANLLCRLPVPPAFLSRVPGIVKPGGHLVLTTPCTWLEEFTPREEWLGGRVVDGRPVTTLEALHEVLDKDFELVTSLNLPFLIREHRRKYQLSVALGTTWRRR